MKKLFWISLLLLLGACKKKVPQVDYPEEHYCEKFAGKYDMYDPLNNVSYEMIVSCDLSDYESDDSIQFFNYANRFDFSYKLGTPTATYRNNILGTVIHPLKDHSGKSTSFSNGAMSVSPRKNILIEDSLYLVFNIDNIAFYLGEGVPYEQCNQCLHYGVKVH
ncbi:MAG: hypothetical protein IPO32_03045 [Crocinitomicaceae bacterium]|nr:hypothetical protein [Crocinitomicaceae bacterium]MBK9590507.1 hypothetical protein [Crocinitomicaceae bacterium]